MKIFLFPGQGSQLRGMGEGLFRRFPEYTECADQVLGYSIEALCLKDPDNQLSQTQFTQPAMYVVDVLTFLEQVTQDSMRPDYMLGHSLGEYPALFAAGVFDFATGLRLVQKRGELMAEAPAGSMAAVLGMDAYRLEQRLSENGLHDIDIANYNSPSQNVISGPRRSIENAETVFQDDNVAFIPLNVSAAFHSRCMQPVADHFEVFLENVKIGEPRIPVIANVTARPYTTENAKHNLVSQICGPVRWTESIGFLLQKGPLEWKETGPGSVLSALVKDIVDNGSAEKATGGSKSAENSTEMPRLASETIAQMPRSVSRLNDEIRVRTNALGSERFRQDYNVDLAYQTGAMYRGIASQELVVQMAKRGLLGILGIGGLSMSEISNTLGAVRAQLGRGETFGVNVLPEEGHESHLIDLCLDQGVEVVEASAFVQVTEPLVRFRVAGLKRGATGKIHLRNKIIAKVSRTEVAEAFLGPPPASIIKILLEKGLISQEQAELSQLVPVAHDLTAEADSGGHTDSAVLSVLVPSMISFRNEMQRRFQFDHVVRVGAAGGIGTPQAVASAFVLGAEYIVTGSINQCTVESGATDEMKDMLQSMAPQETAYAPAGDMFEVGARVQVLAKGNLFHARAKRLYELWRYHSAWNEIDPTIRQQIEEKYFRSTFDEVYASLREKYGVPPQDSLSPKQVMASVFKWYLNRSSHWALLGDQDRRVDYQIHVGPALGAFNQWVQGTELEDWRNRHVDSIAIDLMVGAASLLEGSPGRRAAA